MFTYKPRLIGEGGFSLRVAYQLSYVFGIEIRLFTYRPRGFLPGTYGTCTERRQPLGYILTLVPLSLVFS